MSPDTPAFCTPHSLLRGLGLTLVVNSVIALLLWQSGRGVFDEQMVYSQAIGLSIWALTNAGARWLSRPHDPGGFPRGWRLVLLVPLSTMSGAVLGLWLGDHYATQAPASALTTQNPALLGKIVGMSMAIGVAMTLYFYLRGRSNYLEAELQRSKAQHAEAQLRLLESQLEPHMLFNTLANLRVLITLDPNRAQAMLDHLIAYLRSTLTASRASSHPLSQEFERLNDYLALMAIRMGPRLQVTLELPEALRNVPVPPLLLQPLVENAISHGLEPKVEGGHITVRAWTEDSGHALHLEVSDTGVGMDSAPAAAHGTGFGLTQVRERLATAYGPAATLTLTARPPEGTRATVQMPLTLSAPTP